MDYREQRALDTQAPPCSSISIEKKTETGLIEAFDDLWSKTLPAFNQERTWIRARRLALSSFVCRGRHTITQMITTAGRQFNDWSADYRLFEDQRFDPYEIFSVARQEVENRMENDQALVACMDDTLLKKKGKKVSGTSWRRDPLGPPFHSNLIWGQRFLQISAILPHGEGPCQARAIPINFTHCPKPQKPSRKASEEIWTQYNADLKASNINLGALEELRRLRMAMDEDDNQSQRQLIVAVDGGYTNKKVIRGLPERTTLIGRFRKDAKIFLPPQHVQNPGKGRRRIYGNEIPTPEEIRRDETIPWQNVRAYAAGKVHQFQIKTIPHIRWRATGDKDLRLVIIRPLAYRPSKGHRLLYRDPAYLICTDPDLPLDRLLQIFIWRWEIELNFREEKTILGVGEAQVQEDHSVCLAPQLQVATYAFALLTIEAGRENLDQYLPQPKWRKSNTPRRTSTQKAVNLYRYELWSKSLEENNFSHFVNAMNCDTKSEKIHIAQQNPVFYISK